MHKDYTLYEKPTIPNSNFPIRINFTHSICPEQVFQSHWHEEIEFLYFTEGSAEVGCNSKLLHVQAGDLIIVNSNELHYCNNLSQDLKYYCIIVDSQLLQSNIVDTCEVKYISPIKQNLIVFRNRVCDDNLITGCINSLVIENEAQDIGYELAIKSLVYNLLVLLLRNHVETVLDSKQYDMRSKRLEQLNKILKHIEENYMNSIKTKDLAKLANISEFHFCHLFKKVIGKPLNEYINSVRLSKAEFLLKTTDLPITEIAMQTGYNDPNYFSRIYKKTKQQSPSQVRKQSTF